MKGEKIKAIKYFFNLSFGKEKIKLLISIILPLAIIKLLKNTHHEKLLETWLEQYKHYFKVFLNVLPWYFKKKLIHGYLFTVPHGG